MEDPMTNFPLLRGALWLDAVASGLTGLLLLAASRTLGAWLALPPALLVWAGALFLAWAAVVAWLAARPVPPRRFVLAVIVLNLLYVLDSVLLLALGWVAPNALGVAFVLLLAGAVLGFALLQAAGLRGVPQPAAA
jgi:hypothetical protein